VSSWLAGWLAGQVGRGGVFAALGHCCTPAHCVFCSAHACNRCQGRIGRGTAPGLCNSAPGLPSLRFLPPHAAPLSGLQPWAGTSRRRHRAARPSGSDQPARGIRPLFPHSTDTDPHSTAPCSDRLETKTRSANLSANLRLYSLQQEWVRLAAQQGGVCFSVQKQEGRCTGRAEQERMGT
jgi:hypothetical protein